MVRADLIQLLGTRLASRRGVTDPMFNWREIVKQMVLLEDHLFHDYKACPDCIKKHLLTIEALAEEIPSLLAGQIEAANGLLTDDFASGSNSLAEQTRRWMERLIDGAPLAGVGAEIREIRKQMVPFVADPRAQINRVASAHLARHGSHNHRL